MSKHNRPQAPSGGRKVSVDWGDWTIVKDDLVRQYNFQGLAGPGSKQTWGKLWL